MDLTELESNISTPVSSRSPSPAPSDPDAPPSRHPEYYIHDDMAIFLVERRLFKVHRYFLERESEIFRWMFLCPPHQEGPEGGTDSAPITLPGVTQHEFETLLNYLYKGMHNDFRFSRHRWIALLSIASRYDMDKIRERAILQISGAWPPIDPVDKIILAEKHDVPSWLVPAYISLCHRETTLEESEAMKLGLPVTVKLNRAREAVRALGPRPLSSWPEQRRPPGQPLTASEHYDNSVVQIVNEVFWPASVTPETS